MGISGGPTLNIFTTEYTSGYATRMRAVAKSDTPDDLEVFGFFLFFVLNSHC